MAKQQDKAASAIAAEHEKHCFVVMPFGKDSEEIVWFRGWFQEVIEPAVTEAGFEAKLAANEERPNAINDEIRTHLVYDPMVVVDLGGRTREDEPNPNVMYELGIRHAFGLPLVIMAWDGQRLPFDINNQRAIMTDRRMVDIKPTREKLKKFLKAAGDGNFYRPMDAVSRQAQLEAAAAMDGNEAIKALIEQVRGLEYRIATLSRPAVIDESTESRMERVIRECARHRNSHLTASHLTASEASYLTKLVGLQQSGTVAADDASKGSDGSH